MQRSAAPRKKHRDFTFWDACRDLRIHWRLLLLPIGQYCQFILVAYLSQASFRSPAYYRSQTCHLPCCSWGLLGLIVNAWHFDRTGEQKWHTAVPVLCAGFAFLLIVAAHRHFALVLLLITLGSAFYFASIPCLWSIPTTILSGTTAAAAFCLITFVSQIGAFVGPSLVGYLNDRSHSIFPGIALIGSSYLVAAFVFSLLRLVTPRQNENCARIKVGEAT